MYVPYSYLHSVPQGGERLILSHHSRGRSSSGPDAVPPVLLTPLRAWLFERVPFAWMSARVIFFTSIFGRRGHTWQTPSPTLSYS